MTVHTRRPRPSARPRRSRKGRVPMFAVAGGVAVVALLASGCGARASDDASPDHRSFALQGNTLTIDSDDSALELVSADVDQVKVTRWFQGSVAIGSDPKVTWSMKDDRLTLRLHCSGVFADCSAKHRVEVPRDVAVNLKNRDGSVRASGFSTALTLRTGDGSVRVQDSTGRLEMHSGDGSLHASDVRSRQISADTRDGSIRLELATVPDRVDVSSHDGSVTVDLPRSGSVNGSATAYRVTAKTHDGGVDVSVPRDDRSPHVVTAESRDGKVTVRNAN
ncbi:DUF4097 family beta strand repeat-containing protein [Streptomyces sp. NPDC058001]|uniref:DUF4097 family beta strand repeat-containing protein n=1 Tax=Streptomyces sp. NPDC058001 TaxID=3346300 RepID=UPI0036E6AD08